MPSKQIIELIEKNKVEFVDCRFTDTLGKEQHVAIRANQVDQDFFEMGKMFDGSSIAGWRGIAASDMVLRPDPDTAVMDPFSKISSLILRCDVFDPHIVCNMA